MTMIGTIPYNAKKRVVKMLTDSSVAHIAYIAWGTGTTAQSNSDLALANEIARAAATVTRNSSTRLLATADFTITAAQNGLEAYEAGLFDASAGGNLLYRGFFSPMGTTPAARTVATGDTLRIRIYLTIQQGSL